MSHTDNHTNRRNAGPVICKAKSEHARKSRRTNRQELHNSDPEDYTGDTDYMRNYSSGSYNSAWCDRWAW